MDRPIPTPADRGLIADLIKAILSGSKRQMMALPTIGVPTAFPTPRKNHAKGMRRKARAEGRKFFTVRGKRRRA